MGQPNKVPIKRKEVLIHSKLLCQAQNTSYCMVPFIAAIQKRQIYRDSRLVVAQDCIKMGVNYKGAPGNLGE